MFQNKIIIIIGLTKSLTTEENNCTGCSCKVLFVFFLCKVQIILYTCTPAGLNEHESESEVKRCNGHGYDSHHLIEYIVIINYVFYSVHSICNHKI